jgi:hypothetical protein
MKISIQYVISLIQNNNCNLIDINLSSLLTKMFLKIFYFLAHEFSSSDYNMVLEILELLINSYSHLENIKHFNVWIQQLQQPNYKYFAFMKLFINSFLLSKICNLKSLGIFFSSSSILL